MIKVIRLFTMTVSCKEKIQRSEFISKNDNNLLGGLTVQDYLDEDWKLVSKPEVTYAHVEWWLQKQY